MMGGGLGIMNGYGATEYKGGGNAIGWRGMGRYYNKLTPEQTMRRQYMTDQQIGVQRRMMGNMILHQDYMRNPPER